MKNEIFDIAIEKGYYCNDKGELFSKRKKINPYLLNGYYAFSVRDNDKVYKILFHRFIGFIKFGNDIFNKKLCIRHLDGNPINNLWENLAIGTHSDNMMDKPKEVRQRCAKYANKKYSNEIIDSLRKDIELGMTYMQLKKKYNMCKSVLSYYLGIDCKRTEVLL